MIFEIIEKYKNIIKNVDVKHFETNGNFYRLNYSINFVDDSFLYVSDYLFFDNIRKYSFHFQDLNKSLIFRYDNAPNHPEIKNYPYHKHFNNEIESSKIIKLEDILLEISNLIKV